MKQGKQAVFVCCSNGQRRGYENRIQDLSKKMEQAGFAIVQSQYLYEDERAFLSQGKLRGEELMTFFENSSISHIFDLSGGDMANEILPYLDYEKIRESPAVFWGYSDLTTIINAVYQKAGKASILYQVRNLLYQQEAEQTAYFMEYVNHGKKHGLFSISTVFLQGTKLQGILLGGNIRCLLKLAGTEYMPDFTNKVLLLESYSGKIPQLITYFSQLQQLGILNQISGVLLGTFTELEQEMTYETIFQVLKGYLPENTAVAYTPNIGHGTDSKAIWIGKNIDIKNS